MEQNSLNKGLFAMILLKAFLGGTIETLLSVYPWVSWMAGEYLLVLESCPRYHSLFGHLCSKSVALAQAHFLLRPDESRQHFRHGFVGACSGGMFELVKWIHGMNDGVVHVVGPSALWVAAANGHLAIVDWLFATTTFSRRDIAKAFVVACGSTSLDVVKRFHQWDETIVEANRHEALKEACWKGRLSIAKWLHHTLGEDGSAIQWGAVRRAVYGNHLDVVKWLRDIGAIVYPGGLCMDACQSGHRDMAEWVYQELGARTHDEEHLFMEVCSEGYLEVAKWVFDLNRFDMRLVAYKSLVNAVIRCRVEVVKWLLTHEACRDPELIDTLLRDYPPQSQEILECFESLRS